MEKIKLKVEHYYEVYKCSKCDGLVDIRLNELRYLNSREYKCNKCGEIYILKEDDWPVIKYRINNV